MSDKVVTRRSGNFTTIDNKLINDARLSFKAKGLMLYMLSKPDNWNYNVKGDICKRSTDGQTSVYSAINELVKFGYISRVKSIDGYMTYNLFENCDDNDIPDYSVKQAIDSKPNQENPNQENPNQENPNQENRDVLIRKNTTNTECSNTNDSKASKSPDKFNAKQYLSENFVSEDLINDFILHRKNKRALITKRVIDQIISQSAIAGYSLEQAIEVIIDRGWNTFKADWVKDKIVAGGYNPNKQEALEERNKKVLEDYLAKRGLN